MTQTHMHICPECGAQSCDGLTCWQMLGEILGWEQSDPELFAKHFLTVASYNLQHPSQFTDEALRGLKISFDNYLTGKESVAEIRKKNAKAYDGPARVRKPESERVIILRSWPLTIADVYISGHPQGAAKRVQRWAESIHLSLRGQASL